MATVHFVLAEDRAQSRFLKRKLAEKGSWLHLVVGTWAELLELLRGVFLLGEREDLWEQNLGDAARKVEGAFWDNSLDVAPVETLACLGRELHRLLVAGGPDIKIADLSAGDLDARGRCHLTDLGSLHAAMGQVLPADLDLTQKLLATDPAQSLKKVVVYPTLLRIDPDPWRQALLHKLEEAFGLEVEQDLLASVESVEDELEARARGLGHLVSSLFSSGSAQMPLDESLQWLAVRDPLQEVEVAAGMIQQALREDEDLQHADFALLVPDQSAYALHLQAVFSRLGIPLAGLDNSCHLRDLGAEVVYYFLLSMRKPAPVMALAAFLTSPLLPWELTIGQDLAQRVMDGKFDFLPPNGFSFQYRKLLELLRQGTEKTEELSKALSLLLGNLSPNKEDEPHCMRAMMLGEILMPLLDASGPIAWDQLLSICAPNSLRDDERRQFSREGVAVFTESEEPWRKVRQLLVLGFSAGRYPAPPGTSPVFCDADLYTLSVQSGLTIERAADLIARRRQRFCRQLAACSEKIHFMIPRRNELGESIHPSESLTFMAQLFAGVEDVKDLVRDLEREADRDLCQGLALAPQKKPDTVRELKIADLNLKRNLLQVPTRSDGSTYPLSPSRLATLMVSPLAWLFSRMGLEPKEWEPEKLDVATKGTLAHRVFETLFRPEKELPAATAIVEQVPGLLLQAMREIAPFLIAAEWRLERAHLQKEIEQAAVRWKDFLQRTKGRVLGNEVWLNGTLDGLSVHGSADSLVGLPEGRIFVIDFKKSKSGRRREQMEKGFDSQTSLYRLMLQNGDAKDKDDELGCALRRGDEIGVLYYLMNDQVALADTAGWLPNDLPGAFELGAGISTQAMALIRKRLAQVEKGEVCLNSEGDEKWFDRNAAIKIYALDNSPLLRIFMHPGEVTP